VKSIQPVASFTSNITNGYAPLNVNFTDTSTNATDYYWDFGDGNNSTDENPTHTYSTVGNYTVTLTASNDNGSNSTNSTITVASLTMPTTIKVLRTATGEIDTVDFNYYVKNVMPNEWGMPGWPTETLKAGAMAVKMYGWYHVVHHKYPGLGYDVKDTTADQVYIPGSDTSDYQYTDAVVDATWNYSMTRNGSLFESEYDAGTDGSLTPLYANRLSQRGAMLLGNQGETWDQISHCYYDPAGTISIQTIGDSPSTEIPVITLPIANFTTNVTSGYVPLTVKFTDTSTNETGRRWNFRDGDYSQEKDPVHKYTTAGNYSVILKSINENGTTYKTVTINVISQST
jgi:PKD repeat protein